MSEITKKYKKQRNLWRAVSLLLLVTPILIYTVLAFVYGEFGQKITMGMCLLIAIIFVGINALFKANIRCTLWVLLVGIYVCINNIVSLIIIMAITTALDEFIATPLAKYYANKYSINYEIDKRGI